MEAIYRAAKVTRPFTEEARKFYGSFGEKELWKRIDEYEAALSDADLGKGE